MLSFLREQNAEDLSAQSAGVPGQNSPDGSEETSDQQYVTVGTSRSRVRRSTTLLVILLVTGVACIWYMSRQTTPESAGASTDANEADIARAISDLTGVKSEMFNRMDEIVGKFYEFSEVHQINVNELVKNPFELEMFLASINAEPAAPIIQIDPAVIRRQKAQKQADELNLLSIMRSDQGNCCMIENKVLYANDSIGDFKVVEIADAFVKLLWAPKNEPAGSEKVEITKKLSEE